MPLPAAPQHLSARNTVRSLVASQIREVANAGMGDPDILAFWFGEPDEVTPAYIRDAAVASLDAGETFYTQNFGIPELRDAIGSYVSRLHRPIAADNIAVAASATGRVDVASEPSVPIQTSCMSKYNPVVTPTLTAIATGISRLGSLSSPPATDPASKPKNANIDSKMAEPMSCACGAGVQCILDESK